ncbi:MAG: hypothetical protein AAB370_01480 [Verrucomicrobiota bacterium]
MVVIIGVVVGGVVVDGASHPGRVPENCRQRLANRQELRRLPKRRLLQLRNALKHRAILETRRFRLVRNALNGRSGLSVPIALRARICPCVQSVRVRRLNLVPQRNPGLCLSACSV